MDLDPSGGAGSWAYGVSNGQQVGVANVGGHARAILWTGSAESWTDLSPAGSTFSIAKAVSNGQQVGYAFIGGTNHAGLWSGTSASWVDLDPAGSMDSGAVAVSSRWQAGYANISNHNHACVWNGTAASWHDLQGALSAGYTSSAACAIDVVGNDIWVGGRASNSATGRSEAILWHNVIPEPSSLLALGSGILALGGMICRRRRNG